MTYTARDLQQIGASPATSAGAFATEALRKLAAEAVKPAYSTVVLSGVARGVEFSVGVLTALPPYFGYVVPQVGPQPYYFLPVVAIAAILVAALQSFRLYDLHSLRRPYLATFRIAGAWCFGFLGLFGAMFFLKLDGAVSRVFVASWFFLGLVGLVGARAIFGAAVATLSKQGRLSRRAVIVGGGEIGKELLREFAKTKIDDVRILGVFDDRGDDRSPTEVEGFPKLGNVDDLVAFARTTPVDLAVFALPISAEQRILQMLRKLCVLPIDVRLAAHANRLRFQPRSYSYVGRVPVLDLLDKPIADWDIVLKWAFDKIIGCLALLALSPVLLLTAIAVKLGSRGPIFFKQKRYGFNNELIEVYKFRSMYVDMLDATASKLVTRDDPRVTRVGRFIRKTSIDELPQLFNVVFKSNLSLVGPRPHALQAKAADRNYDEVVVGYFARHRVKPGITGWAQINGWRGETDTPEKIQQRVEHDLYYIENWSLFFDLYILAMTPIALFKDKNAY